MSAPPQSEARTYRFGEKIPIEELIRLQGVKPIQSADDLLCDVWEDGELEEFLAHLYARREAGRQGW